MNKDTSDKCVWCSGTGFIPSTGIMCRTCHGTGVVQSKELRVGQWVDFRMPHPCKWNMDRGCIREVGKTYVRIAVGLITFKIPKELVIG
jgi:DnaJ-class molecular chaperone